MGDPTCILMFGSGDFRQTVLGLYSAMHKRCTCMVKSLTNYQVHIIVHWLCGPIKTAQMYRPQPTQTIFVVFQTFTGCCWVKLPGLIWHMRLHLENARSDCWIWSTNIWIWSFYKKGVLEKRGIRSRSTSATSGNFWPLRKWLNINNLKFHNNVT